MVTPRFTRFLAIAFSSLAILAVVTTLVASGVLSGRTLLPLGFQPLLMATFFIVACAAFFLYSQYGKRSRFRFMPRWAKALFLFLYFVFCVLYITSLLEILPLS